MRDDASIALHATRTDDDGQRDSERVFVTPRVLSELERVLARSAENFEHSAEC